MPGLDVRDRDTFWYLVVGWGVHRTSRIRDCKLLLANRCRLSASETQLAKPLVTVRCRISAADTYLAKQLVAARYINHQHLTSK